MGSTPPVDTSCFENFLLYKKCYPANGTKHKKWKCPGCFRSIMFDRNSKEIPYLHVQTNLRNMGISMRVFKEWADKNC